MHFLVCSKFIICSRVWKHRIIHRVRGLWYNTQGILISFKLNQYTSSRTFATFFKVWDFMLVFGQTISKGIFKLITKVKLSRDYQQQNLDITLKRNDRQRTFPTKWLRVFSHGSDVCQQCCTTKITSSGRRNKTGARDKPTGMKHTLNVPQKR